MLQEGESFLSQEACKQWSLGTFRGLQKSRLKPRVEARLGPTRSGNRFNHSLEDRELRERKLSRHGDIWGALKAFVKVYPMYPMHPTSISCLGQR